MTASSPRPPVRTYGGWRRTRGIGMFGLDTTGTVTLLAATVGLLLLATASPKVAAIAAVPVLGILATMVVEVGGTSIGRTASRRLRWTWAQACGHTLYRADAVARHPGAWDLPGVLAPTCLVSTRDATGHWFALVWNRRTGHLTVTLRCAAASPWLVDPAQAEGWVSNWHSWLASLGYLPMLRAVAVTVDTTPSPGAVLQEAVAARLALTAPTVPAVPAVPAGPAAPADTVALMRELVVRSPATAARVRTLVSITFDPAASPQRPRSLEAAVDEVVRTLPGLESALSTCGVTVLGRATALDLAGTVRAAFDPAARGAVERLTTSGHGAELLRWGETGPVAANERWDSYRHDSGISVSWGWREAPRQQVTADVLTRLLSPGRFDRRVTLVYRPLPAREAARLLENQVNATAFRDAYRRAQHRDTSARDLADRAQAQRAAAEEASGAGVVLLSLYVTTTVLDARHLGTAVADVEARADQCTIRLRRLYGTQSAGFAATLPCGALPGLALPSGTLSGGARSGGSLPRVGGSR